MGGLGVCCSRPWWAGGLGKQGLRRDWLRVDGLGVCCSMPWWVGGLGKQGLRGDWGVVISLWESGGVSLEGRVRVLRHSSVYIQFALCACTVF